MNPQRWLPRSLGELSWEHTEMFLLLLLLPTLLIGLRFSRTGLSRGQQLLSLLLRAGFFLCLVLGMGRPLREIPSKKICQLAIFDVSQSISAEDLNRAREALKVDARALKKGDELHVLAFAESVREVPLSRGEDEKWVIPPVETFKKGQKGIGTNLKLALERGLSYVGSDCHNRFHLFSDGIETREDAWVVAPALLEKGVKVQVTALDQADAQDVAVVAVTGDAEVRVGDPFFVRVQLEASQAARGKLRLYQGEMLNGLDGVKSVELPLGTSSFSFQSVVRTGGEVSYRAEYVPETKDVYEENNQFLMSMDVPGPIRVLVVDRRPDQISHLVDALVAAQFDVDVRGPSAFPRALSEINQFEFVVLSDLGREHLSRGGEALVESYVRGGGGLLVAGGEAGYGPGGWQGSRLEKILPVRMDAKKEREMPGVAMSLVIDRSGSMTGLPLSMAKEACIATLGVLSPTDLIEVIAFDSRPTSYVPLQPARYRFRIEEAVARIQPGGGTEIFNSLDLAYQSLSAVEARRKHIILLTDGNASSDGIYELASTAFAEGITISAVGLGGGTNQSLLTMISETGGGRFIESNDPTRLPRIFTRETELISTKSTLQDWFPLSVAKPAEFLNGVGIEGAPFLRGYTSTQLAQPPSEAILLSDRGEPILARRPLGLGWSLAWTSDLKARWATDFLRFRHFGKLMGQLIRKHQKSDHTEIRPMTVALRGDEVVARVEAYDADENFENNLQSILVGTRHGPRSDEDQKSELSTSFRAVAPGLYEAILPLPEPGAYSLKAEHHRVSDDGTLCPAGVSFDSISLPYPEEYRDLTPRPKRLEALARLTLTGASPEALSGTADSKVTMRQGRQQDFILVAILLFFLDLLVRRVRIFDRGFRRDSAGLVES